MRFKLDEVTTHDTVADEMGLTVNHFRKIERNAMAKIRRLLAARGIHANDLIGCAGERSDRPKSPLTVEIKSNFTL